MTRPHPNLRKMNAGVAAWIEAANGRMDGDVALAKRALWMGEQIARLGRADLTTPAHLEGLTVWDLMAAQKTLQDAAKARADVIAAIRARSAAAHQVAA